MLCLRCRIHLSLIQRRQLSDLVSSSKSRDQPLRKYEKRTPIKPSRAPVVKDTSIIFPRSHMEEELQWLPDPFRLAERVAALLQSPKALDHLKALALTRQASRHSQVVVSWNHLVDWNMSQGHISEALKLYQEMKKRAQKPDGHTFTTLFRGLAKQAGYPKTLERTLSLFHSMYADNSTVTPSIIHINAVLNVCARAGDMDALFGVAAKMPTTGKGAPDKTTFTIVLNGIYAAAIGQLEDPAMKDSISVEGTRRNAVLQGRRIWDEVIQRWAAGDLYLDEGLVYAMGRLLLLGQNEQDANDVFSLIEQTMDIPRQAQRPPGKDDDSRPDNAVFHSTEEHDPVKTFLPLNHDSPLVSPNQKTLGLVIDACLFLRLSQPADAYWNIMIKQIRPDQQNYLSYLRIVRYRHASKRALEIVEEMLAIASWGQKARKVKASPEESVQEKTKSSNEKISQSEKSVREQERSSNGNSDKEKSLDGQSDQKKSPDGQYRERKKSQTGKEQNEIVVDAKVLRLALACCGRDVRNPHAVEHARALVNIMRQMLEYAEPYGLARYLECADKRQPRDWRLIMESLLVIRDAWPPIRAKAALQLAEAKNASQHRAADIFHESSRELANAARSACTRLIVLAREDMNDEDKATAMSIKRVMDAFLERQNKRRKKP